MNLRLLSNLLLALGLVSAILASEREHPGPSCTGAAPDYFSDEVWTKVGEGKCLKCHQQGGDAEDSDFILWEATREGFIGHNRGAFTEMARTKEDGQLTTAAEGASANSSTVVRTCSRQSRPASASSRSSPAAPMVGRRPSPASTASREPFFDGVEMVDDERLLRRLTLSLAGRLPREAERSAVAAGGSEALGPLLDALMAEEAFYDRLAEGFNDIFLTTGID